MRVQRRSVIDADRGTVWKLVSNPDCYPEFMADLERWETLSDEPAAVGSRYTVHWKIGSVPIGGVIEVVEFDDGRDLSWIGITGVSQRGRFRLRDAGDGRTQVTFRLAYESAGNILGLIADRVAARQVGRTMTQTLENLRSLAEAASPPGHGAGAGAGAIGICGGLIVLSGAAGAGTAGTKTALLGHLLRGFLAAVEVEQHLAAAQHLLAGNHALGLWQGTADRTAEAGAHPHALQDLHGLVVRLTDHVHLVGISRLRVGQPRAEQADRGRGERSGPQHNKLLHVTSP